MGTRPTFLGFEASKSALYAAQKSLDITGHNLANMSVEGYTRQRVDQVAVNYSNFSTRMKQGVRIGLSGSGTHVLGIGQVRDETLDTAFRTQYAEVGGYSQEETMLTDIESILQEFDVGTSGNGFGLRNAIQNMYNAIQDFSMDSSSVTYASVVTSSFEAVALSLRDTSNLLNEKCEQYKDILQTDVLQVNTLFEEIAMLNKEIGDAMATHGYTEEYGPNELLDKRNLLLDELSSYGKISVVYDSDGMVNVSMNGVECVNKTESDSINYYNNSDGTVSLLWRSLGTEADFGPGILQTSRDVINGNGENASGDFETAERGFRYYAGKLDSVAQMIAEVCNSTIPDSVDANGNILTYRKFFGAQIRNADGSYNVYPDVMITAENIAISDTFKDNPNFLIYEEGNSDNRYALQLVAKLSSEKLDFGTFQGTIEDYISDYVTTLGNEISYASTKYEACLNIANSVLTERDEVSGVSETEETTNMLIYNRAFQAAAKMINMMDSLLDVVINRMGV